MAWNGVMFQGVPNFVSSFITFLNMVCMVFVKKNIPKHAKKTWRKQELLAKLKMT